jgi:asparagine synthase (glutamine-hydrolysing)
VWLLGDVRLDGRDDLRRKLEQHGEAIAADVTDEELVLRAWRLWGEEGIAELIGDYAFALWDAEARCLRCWRDLMGARPFFYAHAGGWLHFSNTLDAVRCARAISPELDLHFIGDFLLEGWCPDPARTAFRDISRLPSGHALSYSTSGVHLRRFTSLAIEEPLWLKRRELYVEQFRELLEHAVRARLPCGPAAILMSGGLDSTSVAAVATATAKRKGLPQALRAYTVDYRPLFADREGALASRAAQFLGIPVEVMPGANYLPFAGWDEYKMPLPEPLHEPFQLIYLDQVRCIGKHTTVVLTGYGGDSILTGQAWPYLLYLLRRLRFLRIGTAFGGYVLRHRRFPPLRGGFRTKFRQWISHEDPMAEYPKWLAQPFENHLKLADRWRERQRSCEFQHPLHPNACAALSGSFWPNLLESEDSAWNDAAVESRAPLLDLRILRFLLRVPPVPWCVHKELLRQAVRGLLPDEIRLRPKTPLQGDPLLIQVKNRRWSQVPLPAPTETIRKFVDWEKLSAVLESKSVSSLWVDLQPLSLLHWLKSIENKKGFQ